MIGNLEQLRKNKGKTIRGVSTDLDIQTTSLFRMEKGDQAITLEYARKFAQYYGVSIDYIAGYSDPFRKEIIKEVPPTYTNILAGLDALSPEELDRVKTISEWLSDRKKKAVPNGPQIIRVENDKPGAKKSPLN